MSRRSNSKTEGRKIPSKYWQDWEWAEIARTLKERRSKFSKTCHSADPIKSATAIAKAQACVELLDYILNTMPESLSGEQTEETDNAN